jgi:NOL1/NOP2/sun family putative RNA methylase
MNLPNEFVQQTKEILAAEYDTFEAALSGAAPVSVRINTKTNYLPSDEKVPWCDTGYYLPERPLFTADPLLHAGVYYVQEASSMFLSQIVTKYMSDATNVLDLCAAPGGKSTLLSHYLPESSLLVSNEIIRQRSHILAENIIKWGKANAIVTNNEAKDFGKMGAFFDAIVVDAPCSGEGMFRKDPNSINEWSVANIEICVKRQQSIVEDVWDALKNDGILVYSTCTFNSAENEENIRWICENLGAKVLKLDGVDERITVTNEGYRFYPHKTKGEGFFIAILQKTQDTYRQFKPKNKPDKLLREIRNNVALNNLFVPTKEYKFFETENAVFAFPTQHLQTFLYFRTHFQCLLAGIEVYERKGKDLIPTAQLALSKELNQLTINTFESDYTTAIQYLKKESIELNNQPTGYVLITYKGIGLGWVKNIGTRCNNLYPQHWRIRMNL